MNTNNPIEVARETLKQLTARKLFPTPENFERVFNELTHATGSRENKLASQLAQALESIAPNTVQSKLTVSRLQQAIDESRWDQIPQLAIDCMRETLKLDELAQPWGALIQELIRCWELRQPDLPQNFKKTTLERVLINYGAQPDELNRKLRALIDNWSAPPSQRDTEAPAPSEEPVAAPAVEIPSSPNTDSWTVWQRTLVYALKHGLEPRLLNFPELQADFSDGFARLLKLPRHGNLRVARELPGGSHTALKLLPDLPELLRHRCHQVVDLRGYSLRLRRDRLLHLLPRCRKLRVRAAPRRPHNRCHNRNHHHTRQEPQNWIHRYFPF